MLAHVLATAVRRPDRAAPRPGTRYPERRRRLHHEAAKAEQALPEWQAATEALIMAAENRGPLMHARVSMLRALNRHVERVFNPDRKDTHWGKWKFKEGSMRPWAPSQVTRHSRLEVGRASPRPQTCESGEFSTIPQICATKGALSSRIWPVDVAGRSAPAFAGRPKPSTHFSFELFPKSADFPKKRVARKSPASPRKPRLPPGGGGFGFSCAVG
jgi:hypothetical protein